MMNGVPPLSKSIGWTRGILEGRTAMLDLQRQLATGQKATTYGGLGPDRSLSLAMRARMSSIDAYLSTIQTVSLRLNVMTQALTRFSEVGREIRSAATVPSYELTEGNRTQLQVQAQNALDETLSLLRSDVAGRYLFSGRATDTDPIPKMSVILNGEGGKAGFNTVLAERKIADAGEDGLGRLRVSATGDAVTISEDAADSPFGFKITGLSIGNANPVPPAPGPDDAPEVGIDFGQAAMQPGQTVRLALALPDGSTSEIVLKAVEGEAAAGQFQLGADADETAANFAAAMSTALQRTAETELAAASAFAAAEDFFGNPPKRVVGDPATATATMDGTGNTVLWYRGDADDSDPRQTSVGRIDDAMSVSYGARANEEALRWTIQNLAVLASETFDANEPADKLRYSEMTGRVANNLSTGSGLPNPDSVHMQIASQQHTLAKAADRHKALKATAMDIIAGVEHVDPAEVAVQILQLQTRLEASYQTTAMLSRMSLVFHM